MIYYNAFGWIELILLFLILLILFGSKKLPEFARGIGEAIREFRKAASEAENIQKQPALAESQVSTSYQEDPLITAARNKGINVEGKTRLQIVEELAQKLKNE
jgi:sec-independent protein translocase protein TatA